jgi:2,3-dihydroxyphenylpropionate 1,2-dioxygenase
MDNQQTGRIVAAMGMPHTPGLGDQLDRPPADQMARIQAGFALLRDQLTAAAPDVIIAFVNDHFDMYGVNNMPGFAISLSETHWGPTKETEDWIQIKRGPVPGHSDLARDIYRSAMADGFELFRSDSAEFVHNVLIPKKYLWPDSDIPVVPIFMNCFIPPLPLWRRAYELGESIRRVIDRRPERVALLASGGISHWPMLATDENAAVDPLMARLLDFQARGREVYETDPTLPIDLLEREKEIADSGRPMINIPWDQDILGRLADGDVDYLKTLDHKQVLDVAGPGGAEMLMWVTMLGVLHGAKGDLVMYEAVTEWMGGVGLISYASALR